MREAEKNLAFLYTTTYGYRIWGSLTKFVSLLAAPFKIYYHFQFFASHSTHQISEYFSFFHSNSQNMSIALEVAKSTRVVTVP